MKPLSMKSLLLAGALIGAAATACVAQTYSAAPAYSGYWVVGNGAIHSCEIVTSNPVIDYNLNSFGTGPYRSLDDARLARSTIGVCPKDDTAPAGYRMPEDGAADEPG